MAHIAGEVTIDAPADEVFDMAADERDEPRYSPRIVRAEKVSEGPVGRGARFVAEPKSMGAKGEMTVEILEYDRPHSLRNLVRSSYMQVDGTLTFEEVDGATRLRWDWDMGLVGSMRVLSPLLAVIGPGWERRNWVGLKEYMESGHRLASALRVRKGGWWSGGPRGSGRRRARSNLVVAIGGMMPSLSLIAATLVTN